MELREDPVGATPRDERQDDVPLGDGEVLSEAAGARCAVHEDQGAAFTCTRCGTFACDGCAFSSLARKEVCRACAQKGLPEPIPWERRKEMGRIRACWETTRILTKQPTAFYHTPAIEDGPLAPAMYGIIVYTVAQLISNLIMFGGLAIASVIGGAVMEQAALGGIFAGYSVCWMFLVVPLTLGQAPLYALFGILAGGGLTHLSLRALKCARAPFEGTLRAVSYANAPCLLYVIPCLGAPIGWVWMLYLEIVGVREAHGVTTDRAALAVLGWRVLLIGAVVIAYVSLAVAVVLLDPKR